MTKPFEPTKLASDAGALRSAWWRLGNRAWYGTVVDKNGNEFEVEELPAAKSWRATSSAAQTFNASSLEQLLQKLLG